MLISSWEKIAIKTFYSLEFKVLNTWLHDPSFKSPKLAKIHITGFIQLLHFTFPLEGPLTIPTGEKKVKSFLLEILELWSMKESILPTYKYLTRKTEKGDYVNKAVNL